MCAGSCYFKCLKRFQLFVRAFRKGPACTQLNLVPVSPEHATSGSYRDSNRTSWGANVFYSSADGLYHMIVAEMKGNCTLTSWIPSSQIVHAVVSEISRASIMCVIVPSIIG